MIYTKIVFGAAKENRAFWTSLYFIGFTAIVYISVKRSKTELLQLPTTSQMGNRK